MVKSYSDMLLVPFAKYLKKYGKLELSDLGGTILIPYEDSHYTSILFKPKRLPYSADKSWESIASVNLFEPTHFTKAQIPLYQRLKGMECVLLRKGLLRRKYIMKSNPFLSQLQQKITSLSINTYLSEVINQDFLLQDLFSVISPESLTISLFNPPIKAKDVNEYSIQYQQYYDNPTELIWNINLEKYLDGIVSKKKYIFVIDSILQSLGILAYSVRRVTQITESRF